MTNYNLSRLDLNLLVSLDALLAERSVTKAANRLGLSQPALSASLSRLRIHFGDQLLSRQGNSYELTPLASRLTEHVPDALDAVRRVFTSEAAFDPSESHREFTIYGSDYAFATIGTAVSALASKQAPHVRFQFRLHTPAIVEDAVNALRLADGMIIPHGFLQSMPHLDLLHDGWKLAIASDNPLAGAPLTMKDLQDSPWVMTYQTRNAYTPPARQLQMGGLDPQIDVVVEGFLGLPHFIVGTRRLALIQSSLIPRLGDVPGVTFVEPPFEAVPLTDALWWHPMLTRDPAHEWMRTLFAQAASEIISAT